MYSITKNGKELDKSLYSIDEENRTFSSKENDLVLDFAGLGGWTFKTEYRCVFKTGADCTFETYSACTFETRYGCVFDVDYNCVFNTGADCTFKTHSDCAFKTGSSCVFKTSFGCTFKTGSSCTFNTGFECTFKTGPHCTFTTGSDCVLLCLDNKIYRHFLDNSNYVFTKEQLIEIKDTNQAILNMKHESELVRNLCIDVLKKGK